MRERIPKGFSERNHEENLERIRGGISEEIFGCLKKPLGK